MNALRTGGERLGIFGGAFDPVHVGHLFIAEAVRAKAALDRILFLPVGFPAHRRVHCEPEHRREMVRNAIADNPAFALDDTALAQRSPVYTADTLELMRPRYAGARLSFIAGSDSLLRSRWRRLDEVLHALECFYVVVRDPADVPPLRELAAKFGSDLGARFALVDLPLVDVSSTSVRQRIERNEPIRYLVPDGVWKYIESLRLYRNDGPAGSPRTAP